MGLTDCIQHVSIFSRKSKLVGKVWNRYSKPHAWNWTFAQLKQVRPQRPTHLPGWSILNCFWVLIGSVIPVGIHDHIHHPSIFVFLVKLLLELRHRGRPQNNGPPSSDEMMPKKICNTIRRKPWNTLETTCFFLTGTPKSLSSLQPLNINVSHTSAPFPPSHEVKPGNHSGLEWMPSWVKTIQQKGFHHQPSNLQKYQFENQPSNHPTNHSSSTSPTTSCQSESGQSTHTHTTPWSHHPGRGKGPSWPIGSPCNNLSRLLGPRKAPTPLSSFQYPGRVPPSPSQWRCLWCLGWWRWGVLGFE